MRKETRKGNVKIAVRHLLLFGPLPVTHGASIRETSFTKDGKEKTGSRENPVFPIDVNWQDVD